MENCFFEEKLKKEKVKNLNIRIKELKKELHLLKKTGNEEFSKTLNYKKNIEKIKKNKEHIKIKAVRKILTQGVDVFFGKSAQENLLLLRQARAWDYWLHLRDYPSCHGLLCRNKSQVIKAQIFKEAAKELITQNFRKKAKQSQISCLKGEKFCVVFAEVRYVKPLKGDSLGRVTYRNEKTLIIKF